MNKQVNGGWRERERRFWSGQRKGKRKVVVSWVTKACRARSSHSAPTFPDCQSALCLHAPKMDLGNQ